MLVARPLGHRYLNVALRDIVYLTLGPKRHSKQVSLPAYSECIPKLSRSKD